MLTKAKALYQVKLILDFLPQNEYDLIPQNVIDYIEENFEYDQNITINPDIPLEKQNIDNYTYEILDKITKKVKGKTNTANHDDVSDYIKKVKKSNKEFDTNIENIRLKKIIETLKSENQKIHKAKNLLQDYNDTLKNKNKEIHMLKNKNEILMNRINLIPKFIRNIFIKENDSIFLDEKN